MHGPVKSLDAETCADQEQKGERDFRDNEHGPQGMMGGPLALRTTAFFKRIVQARADRLDCRCQTEDDPRGKRQQEIETECLVIEPERVPYGQIGVGDEEPEDFHSPVRQ